MAIEPIDDIVAWSAKLSPWRKDCLRRLAISAELSEDDLGELLGLVKLASGLPLAKAPPEPIPFEKSHFGGGKQQPIVLKGIANVENVNRLVPKAGLRFCPDKLTVIYGRNGSGKSGFVRILRTACRTRVENPAKLRVLADVYGSMAGPQSAEIVFDTGGTETTVAWTPDMPAAAPLMQVGVFDSASAQIYVDGGNQIRYLPFGLALPHRLNIACLTLKERLERERAQAVGDKVALTAIAFNPVRKTAAQTFAGSIAKATTTDAIEKATTFSAADQARLDDVTQILAAGAAAAADISALATWSDALVKEGETALTALSDAALATFSTLRGKAVAAREAAQMSAGVMFTDEPLPGVGSETWRALWKAARNYSLNEAYPESDFPVVVTDDASAACVLCQQPLEPSAADRMLRFRAYMDDTLDTAATAAEKAALDAKAGLAEFKLFYAGDYADRIEQVRQRNAELADCLASAGALIIVRRAAALSRLAGEDSEPPAVLSFPLDALKAFAAKLTGEKEVLTKAGEGEERAKLADEKAELEDRKALAPHRAKLITRRDLLVTDAAYAAALAEVQTTGITKRANELVDAHLTTAVVDRFKAERDHLDINHLNIGLTRKSSQTKAEFDVDPGTKLTKITSEILSEGEQRALALAGFLTEVALTDGSGAVVIDDPVSSLDRERCARVAQRLAEESLGRQVIVFTHDIIFFNELCQAADARGIDPVTVALFSDKKLAGRIDASGVSWKGAKVSKRLGRIKDAFAPLPKLHATSPADYEMAVKNLYGRLRDAYERIVEEIIFCDIVQRGVDAVQTQKLRMVHLSHALAIRFHEGMTKANTHSHDNPAAETVAVPEPAEFLADMEFVELLIKDLKAESQAAEAARPQMKIKA
jgi:energy-coupling factor transporter ATP-binding protein EcfA2